jgi:hypothetical protein
MKKDWARRQTQVVLRDLEAWVVQLWEDHHLRVRLYVSLPSPGDGIKHGVTLEAYQPLPRGQESIAHRDWRTIEETTSGAIEAAALQMASALLLSLEGDRERAQRQAPLPF